jgi:hypothetical protein
VKFILMITGLFLAGVAVAEPRLGLNFVRYHWDRPGEQSRSVEETNGDLKRLGVDAMRQFMRADLVWRDVEPQNNVWSFERADEVLNEPAVTPIVTLFSLQYASGTPPWDQGPGAFRPIVGAHARDYVETVVKRYADKVTYWEIGNEMDHWRAADPGDRKGPPGRRPPHNPPGGFGPEQHGKFVADVAAIIRANDPDAVIVMPGVAGLSPYVLETWLPGFAKGGGAEAVDVVNYHFYGSWASFVDRRARLTQVLNDVGLSGKPVWLTETGSSSDPTLDSRNPGNNSPVQQAADVFRRAVGGWAAGDQAVFWHSHVSSPNRPRNRWRGYGLRDSMGAQKPAYAAMQLLAEHVAPFTSLQPVAGLKSGQYGVQITLKDGIHRWVYWGQGTVSAPLGPTAKAYTSVVPNEEGRHVWRGVPDTLTLSDIPVLLRN